MNRRGPEITAESGLPVSREVQLSTLFRLTDRLFRAQEAADLYEASLDAMASAMDCRRASIFLFDEAGGMECVASRGLSEKYIEAVTGHSPWRRGEKIAEPIFTGDASKANVPAHIRDALEREHIRALAFLPLSAQGVIIGKFMAYYGSPRQFTSGESEIAMTIARQLGFALERRTAEISQRRIAAELRQSQRRFQMMLENAPVMIWMSDARGHCLHLNRLQREFWNVAEDEIAGFDWRTSIHPEDQDRIIAQVAGAMAAKTNISIVGRYRNAKGVYRFLQTDARPSLSPEGEVLGMIGVNADVTEREEAELLRRDMDVAARYRILVEAITDYAIYQLDENGNIVSWNAGAQRFKGYTSSEIVGKHFSIFYTPEDRATDLPRRALAIAAQEGKFETEGWRVRKNGTRFWTHVVIDPIRDSAGKLLGFAKITRDLTERKKAEDERKKAERDLEEAREALFQSQKVEAIGQLTGGVAHDFNNLLMVIQSSMELLRKRLPQDERLLSLVATATEGVKRGTSLTQRMLSFARRQDLNLKPVKLHELVFEMTDLLQRSLGPSVTIESKFPIGLSMVRADANQLEAALLNLAVNARDAMPRGGSIVISARAETLPANNGLRLPPGRYVCLAVEDTGTGMSPEALARATEPFFTTKGIGKGTGLGLSMVHGFAEQSYGRLNLMSEVGVGTTAELWLPAIDDVDGAETADEAGPEAIVFEEPRDVVVLSVDDDALVQMGTTAMLEDLGYTVKLANSGEAALDILRAGAKIDLVLTDQAMPRMTGLELSEAVLALRPAMPIILATGYSELPAESGSKLPRLSKPYSQTQLASAIREALATR